VDSVLVAEGVNEFIKQQRPGAVFDLCIVDALKLSAPAHAAQITAALGTTSDFNRAVGECALCKNKRKVIRANMT
jgi:hypothetical protein